MRRSFATALGEAGVSEVVADAVLNHRQSATRVYQRAEPGGTVLQMVARTG